MRSLWLLIAVQLIAASYCTSESSEEAAECNPNDEYRTYDGSCNNLKNPTWGTPNTAFARLLPPQYDDGVSLPRRAADGTELPNARSLSTQLFTDNDSSDDVTLLVMQFGQFVAHDILTSVPQNASDCCPNKDPQACISIEIPESDPFYGKFDVKCLSVIRSSGTGKEGPRHQINGVSHVLDSSQVYGSDESTASDLREKTGGRLSVQKTKDGRNFLPQQKPNSCFKSDVCYKAGDNRVNQNTELTVLQTLFLREHNRIADNLAKIQPNWDDERLYQEARAILNAEYQNIVYREYVQYLWDNENYPSGVDEKYSDEVNPSIYNIFTAAVFRVFHSGIQGILTMYNYKLNPTKNVNISDWMNSPSILEDDNNFDELLLGLVNQKMQKIDEFYTEQMNGLMNHFGNPYGLDLTAIDIQRGRDHGIPSYKTVYNHCNKNTIKTFEDLKGVIQDTAIVKLRQLYKSVDDIDVFVGLNFEVRNPNEKLGPTLNYLVAKQFWNLKVGDRFFFEENKHFTAAQRVELRKGSIARLICDNSDGITNMTLNPFKPAGGNNLIIPCSSLPSVNLQKWA